MDEWRLEGFGRLIWEAGFVGIAISDGAGNFMDANDAFLRIVDRTRDDLRMNRIRWKEITAPEWLVPDAEAQERIWTEGSIPMREKAYLRTDGTRVPVMVAGARLPDGLVIGFVVDITERKGLESRLLSSERDRMASVGRLAAGVAHEINNPLTYVMSNLDLIAEEIRNLSGASPTSPMRELGEMVNEARHGAERVRKIVREMKTFSRAEEERRGPLDVRSVLELSIDMAFTEIKHRARVVKDFGEVPLVEADEARLGQVFINLLVNAAQAIPEGQVDKNEIRIITKTDASGRALIEVRDTGCGIPSEMLSHIFDPFFTTKGIGEGTGLGLSICHNIVKGLAGEIVAESGPGRGSTFRVVLPTMSLEPEDRQTEKKPAASRPPVGRPGQVLVVDDDPMIGATLRRVLAKEHDVTVVTDGRQALDLLVGGRCFDVILCDVMMPNVTGMDLYAELSRALPGIVDRIVFTTGGAFTPAGRSFLDSIPNQRLEKPFALQNLRALVRGFVR
jgi:two-component system cell cycle sensor histidine kinase/response regulator CckA